MISVTELKPGTVYEEIGQYLLVMSYEHIKIGRGSANVKVKVKNISSGAITEKSYITGAKVNDVQLTRNKVQFLYKDNAGFNVIDNSTFEQFVIPESVISDDAPFLKEGLEFLLFAIEDKPLYIELPKILDYKVVQTAGAVRGNSVGATQKEAVLENSLKVKVPLFIKVDDIIRVDTRDSSYVERAK